MNQTYRRSGRPVIQDNNGLLDALSRLGKPKSNATSFKKGRKKTGGRKAGTANRTTGFFREAMLAGAEAAGNELGGDGLVSYFKWVALGEPKSFLPTLDRRMPQQLEPEQTSPSEEDNRKLHTMEDVCEELIRFGVPPDQFAEALIEHHEEGLQYGRALLKHHEKSLHKKEHSGTAGPTSSTDDRSVEDDASDASTHGDEVK